MNNMINSESKSENSNMNYSVTEKVEASLKKRHKKEARFKRVGFLSVLLGFCLVFILISDITYKAMPAFHQHWVKIDVSFSKDWLGIDSVDSQNITKANYRKALKRSLYKTFADADGRKSKRKLFGLFSSNAEFTLQDYLAANPDALDATRSVWIRFDDDVDTYLKDDPELGIAG